MTPRKKEENFNDFDNLNIVKLEKAKIKALNKKLIKFNTPTKNLKA